MKFVVGPRTVTDRTLYLLLRPTAGGWIIDDSAREVDAAILANDEEIPSHSPRIMVAADQAEIVRRNYSP